MNTEAPETRDVPSWRLLATLGIAGAAAGLLVVLVQGWAEPRIESHRAAVLEAAIMNVLGEPARYDTLYVSEAGLSRRRHWRNGRPRAQDKPRGSSGRLRDHRRRPGFGRDPVDLRLRARFRNVLRMQVLNKEPGARRQDRKDASFVANSRCGRRSRE
jgi:hypothetical protein